jgi:hypothetical protein
MSNAVMDTHSMIFVTIGNLVSPSSRVDGDPLFNFPDHRQSRFSSSFSRSYHLLDNMVTHTQSVN